MDPNRYRFRSVWRLRQPPGAVWQALDDVAGYAEWWPEIRRMERLGEDRARATCRALLPYTLVMELQRERTDRAGGVLQARLSGDLAGWSRWSLRDDERGGTVVVFEEEVEAVKALLRRLAHVGRPVFVANHAVMMWRGERGLRRHLRRQFIDQ